MKKLKIYLYLFFIIFGPKIFRVIDTSVIANMWILVSTVKPFTLKINNYIKNILILISIIIIYSIIISFINLRIDIVFFARLVRVFFSIVGIYVFCNRNVDFNIYEQQKFLINILMIHAVLVIISSTVFLELQEMLRPYTLFVAPVVRFRSSGLTAGFDMAGLLCIIGMVLVLMQREFSILNYFLFVLATLLTSRFSIIFLMIAICLYVLVGWRSIATCKIKICILMTILPVVILGLTLFILTTNMIKLSQNSFSNFALVYKLVEKMGSSYAQTDALAAVEKHFVFPHDVFQLFFGRGVYAGGDPGYTLIINCVGIFGLLLIFFTHFYLIYYVNKRKGCGYRLGKRKQYFSIVILMALLLLNFKNAYFFTRNFFELCLFEFYSLDYIYRKRNYVG